MDSTTLIWIAAAFALGAWSGHCFYSPQLYGLKRANESQQKMLASVGVPYDGIDVLDQSPPLDASGDPVWYRNTHPYAG